MYTYVKKKSLVLSVSCKMREDRGCVVPVFKVWEQNSFEGEDALLHKFSPWGLIEKSFSHTKEFIKIH